MNDKNEKPKIDRIFFRYEKRSARARLHFEAVKERCPELADSVLLIRDRAKDLDAKFRKDAKSALYWFTITTAFTIIIASCAIFLGVVIGSIGPGSCEPLTYTAGFFFALATLVATGVQAFGWHKRFGAMIAARWAMAALVTQIDQETLEIVLSVDDSSELTDEARKRLHDTLATWRTEFALILSTFGKAYGAALEPVKLSKQQEKNAA